MNSLDLIEDRINKLDNVGQQSFDGNDFSFGFNTWKSGTIVLLRKILPDHNDIIEQIQNIELKRVKHDRTDSLAYNLEACKDQAREILQIFIESLIMDQDVNNDNKSSDFWGLLHPKVVQLAKVHFDSDLFADSVLTCLRQINSIIKEHVRKDIGEELDGARLMTRAFSLERPIIVFDDLSTENGRNIQVGYMKIFEGAMIGIRNPKAHANLDLEKNKAIHLLFIASFMFIKLQEAGVKLD
jgi:uncharacterized protein (TIGR02391 family)